MDQDDSTRLALDFITNESLPDFSSLSTSSAPRDCPISEFLGRHLGRWPSFHGHLRVDPLRRGYSVISD